MNDCFVFAKPNYLLIPGYFGYQWWMHVSVLREGGFVLRRSTAGKAGRNNFNASPYHLPALPATTKE
jgi:hypothetical protein